jgi:hypothetical protein
MQIKYIIVYLVPVLVPVPVPLVKKLRFLRFRSTTLVANTVHAELFAISCNTSYRYKVYCTSSCQMLKFFHLLLPLL